MSNFIAVTLRNAKANEEIMFLVRNTEQLKTMASEYISFLPKNIIKPYLAKYIATSETLNENERIDAFCLSAAFLKQSALFQKSGNISVGWTFHEDLESVAKWQQQYQQSMTSTGAELLFKSVME
jgi:hypothetical protein